MPFGFGKRHQAVPDEEYGNNGENDYNAPPGEAFQNLNGNNARCEEEYDLPNEGQFVGGRTSAGQLSEKQRQDAQDSKDGLTIRERLSMVSNTDSINAYERSIKQKKRQNCCQRCYLLILLAIIGLVVGLYFAFGGDSAAAARNTFREAWRPPAPTPRPTRPPTIRPSAMPSVTASNEPSWAPSGMPTVTMSDEPSRVPTDVPSIDPTIQAPSDGPSSATMNDTDASNIGIPTNASLSVLNVSATAPTPSATVATVPITENESVAFNESNETGVQVPINGSLGSTNVTHQKDDHGDGDNIMEDNIFTTAAASSAAEPTQSPTIKSCSGGTEIITLYMYDQVGDGWGDARISITEVSQDESIINEPIFKGGINGFESESIRKMCLKTDSCYSIVVEGGMWMEEIRWGIGHATELELPQAIFRSRNSQSTKVTWLAPADCMFSLYGTCDNVCSEGYGENSPPLDESGNLVEKELAQDGSGGNSNQGGDQGPSVAEGASEATASDNSEPAQQQTVIASNPPPAPISEAPTTSPPVTASPVQTPSAGTQQIAAAPVAPAPASAAPVAAVPVPTAPVPVPTAPPATNSPPTFPITTAPSDPGTFYSAGTEETSMSWSYYSYSYSVSYSSYRRKERRERERGRRRAKRLGGTGMNTA